MIKNLGHIAIRSRDLDESLRFYKDILGLEEAFRLCGEDGKPYIVYLYIAPGQFIELFPNGTKLGDHGREVIGFVHTCLEVEDVQAAFALMKERGAPIDSEIIIGNAKCKQFWLHDPDGNPIELMELPPESMQAHAIKRFTSEK